MTSRRDEDQGFTLLELMVVVVIVGVLAAIAVPTYLEQRRKAWSSTALSDLRNGVVQVETRYVEGLAYSAIDTSALQTSDGVGLSFGAVGTTSYCLQVDHPRLPGAADYHYDSLDAVPVPGAC